jgi:hypothetical protein
MKRTTIISTSLAGCLAQAPGFTQNERVEEPAAHTTITRVTLDGNPVGGAAVFQGGSGTVAVTDANGFALVHQDSSATGVPVLFASLPNARISSAELYPGREGGPALIELTRFSTVDNEAYVYQDPGSPDGLDDSTMCGHCHTTIMHDWYDSAHRQSASNPVLQDLYSGVADAEDEPDCMDLGGRWMQGLQPGTREPRARCYVGAGVLPLFNSHCGEEVSCDAVATRAGACADCHAPGIDGARGGRNLLDATGLAHTAGTHCDVCHHVESVNLSAPAGVAGRLNILRPSDPATDPAFGAWLPLTFGPRQDVSNPRMGSVARFHFHDGTLCAGCHQYSQPVLVPGESIDLTRWPDGELPIHTTFEEWESGPLAAIGCNSCHMPPDPSVGNSADIQADDRGEEGVARGFYRPPGEIKRHRWVGPRTDPNLLRLAAAIDLRVSIGDAVVATATVRNVGPAHAIPTGEPLRSIILQVSAECAGAPLAATGGDAIPSFVGFIQRKGSEEAWDRWEDAEPGHVIRVVRRTGAWHDYKGFGVFGDARLSPQDKGLAEEVVVGESTVLGVDEGIVSLSAPLPEGDVAYLGHPAGQIQPGAVAGSPGFAFARVLVGAGGEEQVPHFMAVDVSIDNRILPGESWTSNHRFAACAVPEVRARLWYRRLPYRLIAERRWDVQDQLMAEEVK